MMDVRTEIVHVAFTLSFFGLMTSVGLFAMFVCCTSQSPSR